MVKVIMIRMITKMIRMMTMMIMMTTALMNAATAVAAASDDEKVSKSLRYLIRSAARTSPSSSRYAMRSPFVAF